MKLHILIFIAILFLIISCSEGPLLDILREKKDPILEVPSVVSFEQEEEIGISWNEDFGADEYILYRALDQAVLVYEVIYRGQKLCVADTHVGGGNRYLYTLGKIKGEKLFGPSDTALGIGSLVINDKLENNNSKNKASKLNLRFDANIYYYQTFSGVQLKDTDWYYVTIPPRKQANIVVTYNQTGGIGLYFYLEGHVVQPIVSGDHLSVTNNTDEERFFYFQISPNTSTFISDPAAGGGNLVDYNIFLHSIITP